MTRPSRFTMALLAALARPVAGAEVPAPAAPDLPGRLSETGLWADPATGALADGVLPYEPQYPLWTDGAAKRRWVRLPPGTAIDAADPDHWRFPVGTRFWKEFAFGRRVETRYMELRPDGRWAFATYAWNAEGTDALRAPDRGVRGAAELGPGLRHDLPSLGDCQACHEAGPVQVLGFSALQLSPDRDPLAPHARPPDPGAVDLPGLAARGLLCRLDPALLASPPRIQAPTARGRAALGYLHGNCGGCHQPGGAVDSLGLVLAYPLARLAGPAPALATTRGVPSGYRPPGLGGSPVRLAPGDAGGSVLLARLATRSPAGAMPPLGSKLVDAEAEALLRAWIDEDLAAPGAAIVAAPAHPQQQPTQHGRSTR